MVGVSPELLFLSAGGFSPGTYRGLNNYLYYFGASLTIVTVQYTPKPYILIIKAPTVAFTNQFRLRVVLVCRRLGL